MDCRRDLGLGIAVALGEIEMPTDDK